MSVSQGHLLAGRGIQPLLLLYLSTHVCSSDMSLVGRFPTDLRDLRYRAVGESRER